MMSDPGDERRGRTLPHPVVRALRQQETAPDMTRAIMGKLGFMRAAPAVVRRARSRRRAGRIAFSLAMVGIILISAYLHQRSDDVRRPEGPTLPAAIGNDLNLHHDRLQHMFRTIRNLTPGEPSQPDPEVGDDNQPTLDPEIDNSAIAHVRWV